MCYIYNRYIAILQTAIAQEGFIVHTIEPLELLSMDFSERLVQLRKARKLTQQALADLAGVHLTQIQRYEAAQTQPTIEVMKKLAIGLSASADLLLFDQEERGPDDTLRLHFEAVRQFDDDDRHIIEGLLQAMILKHQNKRFFERAGATATTISAAASRKTGNSSKRSGARR